MSAPRVEHQGEPKGELEGELEPLFWSDHKARPLWKRALLLVGALIFIVLGVVFWIVPLVTGIPFYIVGFALLGAASPRAQAVLNRAEARLPHRVRLALRRMVAQARSFRQILPRARNSATTPESTRSNGSGDQPSSERALSDAKRK